jgi:hypothetical protein
MFLCSGPAGVTFPTSQRSVEPGSPCSTSGLLVIHPEQLGGRVGEYVLFKAPSKAHVLLDEHCLVVTEPI